MDCTKAFATRSERDVLVPVSGSIEGSVVSRLALLNTQWQYSMLFEPRTGVFVEIGFEVVTPAQTDGDGAVARAQ